ncbi:Uncharacterised protein [Rhodococcus rhodochrous]|uniref:hypothetical protein n=1 Tax=Rhodococcus rhodochrous TaxID=1829 RepID=UPI0007514695|nr:hypothetical protein [Rhodococcus rhodochrous]MDO1486950.1 hypothetical protein [Rhodococcus rhodochrous]SNV27864.1 Uncharacterised protein [Rhodococcus rhodochrous]
MQNPPPTTSTDLLDQVTLLIAEDQPHLAYTDETRTVLRHFEAFHDGAPQSYLGYRYRLRVLFDGQRGSLPAVDVLRFIAMTVDDGRSLRQHLNKKYGPFDEPGFGGGQPDNAYVDEATEFLAKVESWARWKHSVDTATAESETLSHLENMIALLLASDISDASEVHDYFMAEIFKRLDDAGISTTRAFIANALIQPLLDDRAHDSGRAVQKIRAQFRDLREGRYDFLRRYEDSLAHRKLELAEERIDFEVLPPGTDPEAYARREHRRTAPQSGPRFAPEKLQVLKDLEHYFGPERCQWLHGKSSRRTLPGPFGTNINGSYLVLLIRHVDRSGRHIGDDAIALSPLTGQATFYVRHDAVDHSWKEIFSYPKRDAKAMGARRLHLKGPTGWDPATALRERLIALAQCSPRQFREGTIFPVPGSHKYTVT